MYAYIAEEVKPSQRPRGDGAAKVFGTLLQYRQMPPIFTQNTYNFFSMEIVWPCFTGPCKTSLHN